MVFGFLFIFPLLIALGGFIFLKGITWKEFLAQIAAQALVIGCCAGLSSCGDNTSDTETLNGFVTKKEQESVHCSHSYDCHCHQVCSGSRKKGTRSCSEHCDTCYRHSNDWDWDVNTSIAQESTLTIDRIDSRGSDEPPRWTAVKMGEPVSVSHSYTNYVKGAPDTLFRHQGLTEKYKGKYPTYPGKVYDYYKVDRVVTYGVTLPDLPAWNAALSDINARLGTPKQVNMILVLVKGLPQDYFYALQEAWLGGKKNDAILVIDMKDDMSPEWATVMAWTSNEMFNVRLRDDVMDEGPLTKEKIVGVFDRNVQQYYKRKHMADFKYLMAGATPSVTFWVISMIIGFAVSIGLTVFFNQEDFFGDENRRSWE